MMGLGHNWTAVVELILLTCCLQVAIQLACGKTLQDSGEKKADLSKLISETLSINIDKSPKQSAAKQEPGVRDDWTFERVEYDLIEFLQQLNARYQHSNGQPAASASVDADAQSLIGRAKSNQTTTTTTTTRSSAGETPKEEAWSSAATSTRAPSPLATQQLPVSLASDDQEISESNWQYGIFDRFTRAHK